MYLVEEAAPYKERGAAEEEGCCRVGRKEVRKMKLVLFEKLKAA